MTKVLLFSYLGCIIFWYFNFFIGKENPITLSTMIIVLLIGWLLSDRLDKIEEKIKGEK